MISPAQLSPDLSGTVLEGAYRLNRLIGQGGMGAVYEAIQLRLNKRVAVKLMSRSEISDMVSLMRFHREAEITSKLGHPHLVNVVDFGTAETGQPYLVMEYLEGEDLDHRLQRTETLAPDIAARIVVQAASALGAAHAQDIVHRDLKPANIFLLQVPGEPEFVKVLDFGISKIKASHARRLTDVRAVVGTPSYMSPEQATGRADDTDHRADQWALACIAWEMLCGHPPFVGDDVTALFFQITRLDPPSLVREIPNLAPGVEEVLRRALSRRHLDRFPSIREFGRAFESAVLGYATDLTPAPARTARITDVGVSRTTPARLASEPSVLEAATMAPGTSLAEARASAAAPVTEQVSRSNIPRRWLLIAGAALAVTLSTMGLAWLRSPAAAKPAPVAATAESAFKQPSPRPSPIITPTQTTGTAEQAPPPQPSPTRPTAERSSKGKMGSETGSRGHALGKPKQKALNLQSKHRLFKEL
jgi:eukaryotic-like serine/threonine-protein kinase